MFSQQFLTSVLARLPMRSIYRCIFITDFYEALKCLNFIHIYRRITHWSKTRQLNAFIDYYHWLPLQGGAKWIQGRALGIGGSEMSVLTEENEHKDMRNLIAGKVKLPEGEFDGSIATRWGNLFEPVLNLYVELLMNVKIYETGSIPGIFKRANGKPIQNYSPDGLAVVKKEDYKYVIDQTSQHYFNKNDSADPRFKALPDELILLYEFKNPYMRLPKGVVKADYISQPKTGMCTIPIVDATLFVDGVIRKCSIGDFDLSGAYDTRFHCRKMRKLTYDKCIACGFIGIMDTSEPYENPQETKEDEWDVSEEEVEESTSEPEYDAAVEDEENAADRVAIIDTMAKQLASYSIKETRQSKSEYYKMTFALENLVSMVRLVMNFFHNLADSEAFHDVNITFDEEVKIIGFTVRRLFVYQRLSAKKTTSEEDRLFLQKDVTVAYKMIPDILKQLNYEEPAYDISDLHFGTDYGLTAIRGGIEADDFEQFVEHLVGDKHNEVGLKMYYPDKFFFDVEGENASRLMNKGNYIDYTTNKKKSANKWLFHEISDFIEYCKKANVKPRGVLPWKLFEACAMPMYKEPDFLKELEPKIRETVAIIDEIMATSDMDERMEILGKYYSPPKAKRVSKPRAKKLPIAGPVVTKSTFNQETMDDFADLDD